MDNQKSPINHHFVDDSLVDSEPAPFSWDALELTAAGPCLCVRGPIYLPSVSKHGRLSIGRGKGEGEKEERNRNGKGNEAERERRGIGKEEERKRKGRGKEEERKRK